MKVKLNDINNLISTMENMKAGKELIYLASNKKEFDLAKKLFPDNIKVILKESVTPLKDIHIIYNTQEGLYKGKLQ